MHFLVIIIVKFTNHVNIWHAVLVSPSICDKRICIGLWKWNESTHLSSSSGSGIFSSSSEPRDVILQCPHAHLSEKGIWRIFLCRTPEDSVLTLRSSYRRKLEVVRDIT